MVKKTISELDDILLTQESSAVVAIEQNGATFKAPVRPNPTNQINVSSQAQLEASLLGTNLIVPDGQTVAVVVDAPFTLTKPFQIGDDSVLELYGAVSQTELTWNGTGALFRNVNPVNLIDSLLLHDIFIKGDTTNALFDIQSFKFVFVTNIQAFELADLGAVKAAIINLDRFSVAEVSQGIRLTDVALCKMFSSGIANILIGSTGITFCSIVSNTFTSVIMDEVTAVQLNSTDSVFFLDPNSTFTTFVIEKSPTPFFGGVFYQPDNPFAVASVSNFSGMARFNLGGPAHELVIGRAVILSGFSESSYNGTFFVTNIPTATEFEVGISFVAGDSGNLNTGSLDSTAVNVEAERNPGQIDSMTQAEGRSANGFSFASVIGSFEPLQDTSPATDDFVEDPATERFIVNDMTGVITYTGIASIIAEITFELVISKSTGGTDTATLSLFNGVTQQAKTDQILSLVGTATQKVSYNGGLFTINPGDTFQLQLNNESVATITVSALKVLIQR